jgi:arylsulfatase A-like enzyme
MSWNKWMGSMSAVLLFGVCAAQAAERPNILLILSDDQSWTDYSFMGHPDIKTPHIDKLAEGGVLFRRGYVATPLCRPSLMNLVTGHYGHRNGVTGNDPSKERYNTSPEAYSKAKASLISKIDEFDTLPELLVRQGYLTHQSGKWWEGNYRRGGFTHGMTRGFPQKGGRHGDDGLKIGREGIQECTDFIDMALAEEKPFFMWYAPFMPHSPHTPPERLLKKYKAEHPLPVAKYYAMCEWFDETCGELLSYFEQKGILENTLVVYLSDNGWVQRTDSNSYAPRSKRTPYEAGARQPTIFSWPAKLKPQDRPEPIISLDIFPTILAAAGADSPAIPVPGLNLLPEMEKQKPIKRKAIFGECFAHDIADIKNPEASLLYRWVIEGDWKLMLTYDGKGRDNRNHKANMLGPQLFNLKNDPNEKNNLASGNSEKVSHLSTLIEGWYPLKERRVNSW